MSGVTSLIPSPDWFVGVQNVSLCQDGQFLSIKAVDLQLYDAGTDNGLTFTAPNWRTEPRGGVEKITNLSPSHPAASFYYPHLTSLPTIARYVFTKVAEFGGAGPEERVDCSQGHQENITDHSHRDNESLVTIETFDVTVTHPLDKKEFKYEIVKERPEVLRSNETGEADKRGGGPYFRREGFKMKRKKSQVLRPSFRNIL